jgi:hypothetical protein
VPALPDVPSVIRAQWRLTKGTDVEVFSRFFFRYTGTAPSDATATLIANDMWLAYSNHLMSLVDASTQLDGAFVVDLTSPSAGAGEDLGVSPGTRTGGELPAATCALVNLAIARRYRGGKPRSYFPFGVATDLLNPQAWTTTFLGDVATALNGFFNACLAITEGGCSISELVNVGYYGELIGGLSFTAVQNPTTKRWRNVPNVRTTPLVDPVLSYVLNAKPGNQRRRAQHSS